MWAEARQVLDGVGDPMSWYNFITKIYGLR